MAFFYEIFRLKKVSNNLEISNHVYLFIFCLQMKTFHFDTFGKNRSFCCSAKNTKLFLLKVVLKIKKKENKITRFITVHKDGP